MSGKRYSPEEVVPKTIRHTMATHLRGEVYRAHPWDIQGMLGHANRSTSEIYSKFQPEQATEITRQLDRIISDLRSACDPQTVTAEIAARKKSSRTRGKMVGAARIELATPTMST